MERFSRREAVLIGGFVMAAAAAGVFAWKNFTRAFPEASLTFTVNRSSSQPLGETFLRDHAPAAAAATAGRRHAAIFRVEERAKLYLERELGLERMAELIQRREVRPWRWVHRYFLPLDKEEVTVEVTPEGEVAGFAHAIPEERPGASLEEEEARERAMAFLVSGLGLQPDRLRLVESHREERPARRDWAFTYERAGWTAGEATVRMEVEVHGDEVAGYREYLKIPEAWTQSYQRLRSGNETSAMAAVFGIVLTLVAAVAVLVRAARRRDVRWRLAFALTAASFLLFVALALNDLPTATFAFDTTQSWGGFLASQLLRAIGAAGVQSLLILVVVAAGESLYRARFPERLQISALLTPAGWRSKQVALGLILGYCLAALFIAYQVAFYLVGKRIGAWNPADVPFDNLLNTTFPWLAVLFIGFYPAVSEEFLSRVFSIPLVEKLARSKVAAVTIPAVIWGFAHANYPAQPFYIRGVEVAVAGVLVGIVFYRFGVVPCLVWHYVVDAGYTSMLLVRSGNPYFVVTALAGTGVLLVPLAVALIAAWRAGGFVADPALANAADPPAPAPEVPPPSWQGTIVAPPASRLLPVGVAAVVAGVLLLKVAPNPGRGVGATASPAAVRQVAERFLAARGVEPGAWQLAVTARGEVLGPAVRRFLLEHGGVALVGQFAREVPQWRVRAFRSEEREEWEMDVDDRTGQVVRFQHAIREEAAGPALAEDEARALAEAALREAGLDPTALEFEEVVREKKPARLDRTFTYRDPDRSVGEAKYLIAVTVQGDEVGAHQRRIKLPEAWERQRARATVAHYALIAMRIGSIAWLVVEGLLLLLRAVRAGAVPWKHVFWGAAFLSSVVAAGLILQYPLTWQQYMTAWPLATFRAWMLLGLGVALVFQAVAAVAALAVIAATCPSAVAAFSPAARTRVAASSVGAALAVVGAVLLAKGGVAVARALAPRLFPDAPVAIPETVATALPALAGLGGQAMAMVLVLAAVAVASHYLARNWRRWHGWAFAAVGVLALVPGGADATAGEFACGLVQAIAVAAVAWLVVRHVLAGNPVAYVLAAGWLAAVGVGLPLLAQPGGVYAAQGAVLLAGALGIGCVWALRRGRGAAKTPAGAAEGR